MKTKNEIDLELRDLSRLYKLKEISAETYITNTRKLINELKKHKHLTMGEKVHIKMYENVLDTLDKFKGVNIGKK